MRFRYLLPVWLLLAIGLLIALRMPLMVPLDNINAANVYESQRNDADRAQFRQALAPALQRIPGEEGRVLYALAWVMNQIPKVGGATSQDTWRALELGRRDGLTCGPLSRILRDALLTNGIKARRVILFRNFFNMFDTHSTLEAFVAGKWRVYDPTFHVALKQDGQRIGVQAAREKFIKNRGAPVEFEFLGDVTYPVRVENYPVYLPALFNNFLVEINPTSLFHAKVLAYPRNDQPLTNTPFEIYDVMRNIGLYGLLIANVICAILVIIAWRAKRRLKRAQASPKPVTGSTNL
jgi:hypothetical protein